MNKSQRRFDLSIRSRIVVLLLVTILPIAVLHAFLHYGHFKQRREAAIQTDIEIARALGASFGAYLTDLSRQSLAIGTALALPGVNDEEAQSILRKNLPENAGVRAFSWVSPEGLITASTASEAICLDMSDRDYFTEVSSGKTSCLTDLRPSKITGEPILGFARGIRSDQGELVGIVYASVLPKNLYQTLGMERPDGIVTMILDSTGGIAVSHPPTGWTPGGEKLLAEHPAVREARLGKEAVAEIDLGADAGKWVLALSPIGPSGWVAVSARTEREIRAPLLPEIYKDAGLFLLFAVAVVFFAFGISRTIAAPIQELRARISLLADGRKNQPLIIQGPPEVRHLTETFNQMAEEIHARETERFDNLARMQFLLDMSVEILSETTNDGLIKKIVDASRALTGAKLAIAGLIEEGVLGVEAVSADEGEPACPPRSSFQAYKNGIFQEIIKTGLPLRCSDAEMRANSPWKGLADGLGPLRGILGAPLLDLDGKPSGLILVTDRKAGDFTLEDEAVLTQAAAIASLGIVHVKARDRAEKRAAEAESGRSILDALMENIPEGISIATAPDVYITMVSKYGRELTGRPVQGICGTGVEKHANWKVLHSDALSPVAADDLPLNRAVLRGEVTTDAELIIETARGEKIPILCNAGPIRDKDGNVLGGIVAWRDISAIKAAREQLQEAHDALDARVRERTAELADMNIKLVQEVNDRKRAEEQLLLGEENYRLLAENVRQFIFTMGPNGELDYCNRFWTDYTGLPMEDAKGDGWMRVLHPTDLRLKMELLAASASTAEPQKFEKRLREGASGRYRWFLIRLIPLGCRDDRVVKWLGTAIDIDDRKTLEEALNRRQQEFRALAENSPDIVMRFDANLCLSYSNRALSKVLGVTSRTAAGKMASELGFGEDAGRVFEEGLEQVWLTGEGSSFEFEMRGKAGTTWFEARLAPELSRAGVVESVLAVCRNITERMLVEEERGIYTTRLEQSNKDLDSFAAVASHDLQEPLRKIQAFGDRLEQKYRGKLDETGLDYIKRMQRASGRMQAMVRSLLNFSRVSTDQRPLSDTDLRRVLKKVVQDLEFSIEQKRARVEIGNLPVIQADPDQMRHLFLNLIGNSLKFSGDEAPLIEISAGETVSPSEEDSGSQWYDIMVKDNGIGFDEEYLERVFGLFQRLHGRSAYEGSGVGLAICKKVVERHNGSITARSEPGKGTTFIISLPRRQPAGQTSTGAEVSF